MSANCSKSQTSISSSLQTAVQDPTKIAKLSVAVYIAEHSSTVSVDHLEEVLLVLDKKKSTILQNFKLHRTKCSRLQKNVLAPYFQNR